MKQLRPVLLSIFLLSAPLFAGEVEVLHWWAESSEAQAIEKLRVRLEQQRHSWKDFPVEGGGGGSAMAVLKIRALSGNPPSAAQLKGMDIQEWANLGFLSDINDVAISGRWDKALPKVVASAMKHRGSYVAVPLNIHRVNWLWINKKVFNAAGAKPPTTLTELLVAAEKIEQAGYIALAHGGQEWQDATTFESIALSVLGADDYRRAFVEHDPFVLAGEKMVEALRYFKKLSKYVDSEAAGRDWLQTTALLADDKAGMLIMGDWSKGELTVAGKTPDSDYLCVAVPGTQGAFSYNVDSFAMFRMKNSEDQAAQKALAQTMMLPAFQTKFNQIKGSIPARIDLDMQGFDSCSTRAMQEFIYSNQHDTLVPSWSHGMATNSTIQQAITDVISEFFNSPDASAAKTARQLARAVKSAM